MGRPAGRSKTIRFSFRRLCGSYLCGRLLPRDASAQGAGRPADRGMRSFGCVGNARGGGDRPPPPAVQGKANGKGISGRASDTGPAAAVPHPEEDRGKTVVAMLSEEKAFPQDGPSWMRGKEELVYKGEFLGS